MEVVVFFAAAAVALVSALVAVSHRDPVVNVLSLVVTMFCVAVNYALLGASFLAAAQILVYAGAILVLFLFVVMLLNLRFEDVKVMPGISLHGGIGGFLVGVLGFVAVTGMVVLGSGAFHGEVGSLPALDGGPAAVGIVLFRDFLFPFEVVSVLLLAAIVGSVALTKKRLP